MIGEGIDLANCALRLGLREENVRELAELGQQQAVDLLADIEDAVGDHDLTRARRHGHSLKTVCRLFGAESDAAVALERCESVTRAKNLLPSLFAQVQRFHRDLGDACQGGG
jgi:HPt (histidine-containing phosphotransfer) domain-containing protein